MPPRRRACLITRSLTPLPLPRPLTIPPHPSLLRRWEWWNVWFEAALLLALLVTCFLEDAFKRGRLVFLAFIVLVTQGTMWSAHNFIVQISLGPLNVRDIAQDAVNAAAAGFVLLSLTNFALIIVLGKDFGYTGPAAPKYQATNGGGLQFQVSAPV